MRLSATHGPVVASQGYPIEFAHEGQDIIFYTGNGDGLPLPTKEMKGQADDLGHALASQDRSDRLPLADPTFRRPAFRLPVRRSRYLGGIKGRRLEPLSVEVGTDRNARRIQ